MWIRKRIINEAKQVLFLSCVISRRLFSFAVLVWYVLQLCQGRRLATGRGGVEECGAFALFDCSAEFLVVCSFPVLRTWFTGEVRRKIALMKCNSICAKWDVQGHWRRTCRKENCTKKRLQGNCFQLQSSGLSNRCLHWTVVSP